MRPGTWMELIYVGVNISPLAWRLYAGTHNNGDSLGFEIGFGPLRLFGCMPWKRKGPYGDSSITERTAQYAAKDMLDYAEGLVVYDEESVDIP